MAFSTIAPGVVAVLVMLTWQREVRKRLSMNGELPMRYRCSCLRRARCSRSLRSALLDSAATNCATVDGIWTR